MVTIFKRLENPATSHDIRKIAGPIDDDVVAAILHTGATPGEVLEAYEWLEEEDDDRRVRSTYVKPANERARRVFNILDYERNGFNWETGETPN